MKNKFLTLLLCLSIAVFAEEKAPLPLPTTGNVTLTLAEYNRLVDLAAKSGRKSDLPPIPYTLKRADMKLRVAGGTVTGSLLMDGAVFSRNAAKVPLTTGVTILSAQQEGRSLPLEQEGTTSVAVLAGSRVRQAEPSQFVVEIPKGYEITGAAGATVESIGLPGNTLVLHLTSGTPRSHQFLISMERPLEGGTKADTPFLSFKDAQRETG